MDAPVPAGEDLRQRPRGPDRRRPAGEPVLAAEDVFAAGEAMAWNGIERRRRPRRKEDVRQRLRDQWAAVQRTPWRAESAAVAVPEPAVVLEPENDPFFADTPRVRPGLGLLAEVPLVRVSLALTLHGLMLARQLLSHLR